MSSSTSTRADSPVPTTRADTTRAETFAQLHIQPGLVQALSARGIVTPTPIQADVIPLLLHGRDVMGQARTGSGKTLAFGLPLLQLCDPSRPGVQALALVPTRELAIQVGDVIGHLANLMRLRLTLLYGGRSLGGEKRTLPTAQIVIGTPGRTLDHLRQGGLSLKHLRMFVLDEGDEMLDRGFAPDVERILAYTPTQRQTALFSATLPDWVAETASKHLRVPVTVAVNAGETSAPDIEHVVYDVDPAAKLGALMTLLDRRGDQPVIVFGRTKHGVKKLALRLAELGYPSAALQGNLSQNARERVMADFRAGRVPILLATNVAARGLDVQDVDTVINYELPESAQWFTHRVGRTGRMGRSGQAITFVTHEDTGKWREIERALGRKLHRQAWTEVRHVAPPTREVARGPRPTFAPPRGSRPAGAGAQSRRPSRAAAEAARFDRPARGAAEGAAFARPSRPTPTGTPFARPSRPAAAGAPLADPTRPPAAGAGFPRGDSRALAAPRPRRRRQKTWYPGPRANRLAAAAAGANAA